MRLLLIVFSLLGLHFNLISQNLVPNSSFENYSSCPNDASQLDSLYNWFNPNGGSSDYFNSCFTTGFLNVSVPSNFFGYQQAVTGNGYIGLYLFYPISNYREYAEVQLTNSLSSGVTYYISLKLSLTDSSNYATDELGIYFSNDSLISGQFSNFTVTPQIKNQTGNYIADKVNWVFFSGEYIASGGEKYITIGNFSNDANTSFINVAGGGDINNDYYGYYLIDDVCVSTSAETCGITGLEENSLINISIFPNPSNGITEIHSDNIMEEITILSSNGESIEEILQFSNNVKIDLSNYSKGLYYVKVKIGGNEIFKKLIIN